MEYKEVDIPGPKRNYTGHGRYTPKVVWPNDAKLVVNLVVNYEAGSEYSLPAGDDRTEAGLGEMQFSGAVLPGREEAVRDLCMESIFEYDSRAGVWRLMRIFDEYGVKATFFATAVSLQLNPGVGEWIREAGHEPCSHGWRLTEQWGLSPDDEREQIRAAVAGIEQATGERPYGWYSRYMASVNTRELLVEEGGFVYDSDAYNDDLPYFVEVSGRQHLVVPYTYTYNDGRFVLPQGYGSPGDFFEFLRRGVDELRREGHAGYPKMMSVGLHGRWVGQAGRASALREFIEYVAGLDDVTFMRRIDIARWWLDHSGEWNA